MRLCVFCGSSTRAWIRSISRRRRSLGEALARSRDRPWSMAAPPSASWERWPMRLWPSGGDVIGVMPQALVDKEIDHIAA